MKGIRSKPLAVIALAAATTLLCSQSAVAAGAGHIKGHVEDASHGPLDGICVEAYSRTPTGTTFAFATTGTAGDYDIGGLASDAYYVEFHECRAAGTYVEQWYNGQPDSTHADLVSVTSPDTVEGIDATMQPAGRIQGHVEDALHTPLKGICVLAESAAGGGVSGEALTDARGDYDIGALASGDYKVTFGCALYPYPGYPTQPYATQWYSGKSSPWAADLVSVTASAITPGIDFTLTAPGTIAGHVEDATTHGPIADICAGAFVSSDTNLGHYVAFASTDANGDYAIHGLLAGTYVVGFESCPWALHHYTVQWFDGNTSGPPTDLITVGVGATVAGVDAAMSGPSTSGPVAGGGTLATGTEASASNPVIAAVTLPAGVSGNVLINQDPQITTAAPIGFALFGRQFVIYAPSATAAAPLTLKFTIDAAQLSGADPAAITAVRDGSAVAGCSDSSAAAAVPDPCLKSRTTTSDGDAVLTVLSSHASVWNFGKSTASPAAGDTGGATSPTTTQAAGSTTTTTTTTTGTTRRTPPTCIVPSLKGKKLATAKRALHSAHCAIGKVSKRHAAARLRGKVISSKPGRGARRPAGTKVALVVGKR